VLRDASLSSLTSTGLGMLVVVIGVVLVVALHALIQRRFRSYETFVGHNDVAGFLLSVVSVIYAVVLGFVVVVVWQRYGSVADNVDVEVASVSDLYRSVATYPAEARAMIRQELREYVRIVVYQEWPGMAGGRDPRTSLPVLEKLAYDVDSFEPKTRAQNNAQSLSMQQLARLFDARRLRLHANVPSVPSVLWIALSIGAVATVGFSFLFGVKSQAIQLVMTGVVAFVVGVMFLVIVQFDRPFSGGVGISPSGWLSLQDRLSHIR
jgi:heme/copper-type cytochrome/quinol oxidase subunit 2